MLDILCSIWKAAKVLKNSLQQWPSQTLLKLLCATAAVYLAVDRFTLVHPYLLADNRSGSCSSLLLHFSLPT